MSPEGKVTELHPEGAPGPHGRGPGNGGSNYGERLASIEAHMKHMATKAWVLGGVVGGMVAAALITLAVIRLFEP